MARIPPVTRDAVPPNEQAAYDAFAASRGSEPKIGPYSIIAHMPEMAQRLEALRTYQRKEASISQKLQELVMLTVARGCSRWRYCAATRRAIVPNRGLSGLIRGRCCSSSRLSSRTRGTRRGQR